MSHVAQWSMPGTLKQRHCRIGLAIRCPLAIIVTLSMTATVNSNHDLCTPATIEPLVRATGEVAEGGCTQRQRCSSPSGLWHPPTSSSLLCTASAMVITIVSVQPSKLLHTRKCATGVSHGLTRVTRRHAGQRTAPWKHVVVARWWLKGAGW